MTRVLLFAQAASLAGTRDLQWPITEPVPASAFWSWLLEQHPNAAPLKSLCRLARNGVYLQPDELIEPGDELAVLPPVSGG
jgi:molybdopterin converting factor small subunit